jgi:hypothetical protein
VECGPNRALQISPLCTRTSKNSGPAVMKQEINLEYRLPVGGLFSHALFRVGSWGSLVRPAALQEAPPAAGTLMPNERPPKVTCSAASSEKIGPRVG